MKEVTLSIEEHSPVSLANVDHLLDRACNRGELQKRLTAAHSVDELIAIAAEEGCLQHI